MLVSRSTKVRQLLVGVWGKPVALLKLVALVQKGRPMFSVRPIRAEDFSQVHEFTLRLLRHHVGECEKSDLEPQDLSDLFKDGFIEGLLLTFSASSDQELQPIGFMIFHSDISPMHGGRGVYLDQFYIEPEFRRHGLGRLMMSALCEKVIASNGQYVKLVYQDGLGLECVYGKMGFVNYSKEHSELHFFEVYGKPKLEELLNHTGDVNGCNRVDGPNRSFFPGGQSSRLALLVLPFSQTPPNSQNGFPAWSNISPETESLLIQSDRSPPCSRMVLVTESCPDYTKAFSNSRMISRPNLSQRLCMFIEQCSVCSWLGPMVTFSDFVGDTSILEPNVFTDRVRAWIQMCPRLSGAVWEVPTKQLITSSDTVPSCPAGQFKVNNQCNTLLTTLLDVLRVPDDTSQEGWNIAYLDKTGMIRLIESTKRKFREPCTCVEK
ncbi:acetyltransferase, GNAT family, partial [Opisthorchis viverrini]